MFWFLLSLSILSVSSTSSTLNVTCACCGMYPQFEPCIAAVSWKQNQYEYQVDQTETCSGTSPPSSNITLAWNVFQSSHNSEYNKTGVALPFYRRWQPKDQQGPIISATLEFAVPEVGFHGDYKSTTLVISVSTTPPPHLVPIGLISDSSHILTTRPPLVTPPPWCSFTPLNNDTTLRMNITEANKAGTWKVPLTQFLVGTTDDIFVFLYLETVCTSSIWSSWYCSFITIDQMSFQLHLTTK